MFRRNLNIWLIAAYLTSVAVRSVTAVAGRTGGVGNARPGSTQRQASLTAFQRLPGRMLMGFEAFDYAFEDASDGALPYIYTYSDSEDVEGAQVQTAPVCDGVAGFDGNEVPFNPELNSSYNLLSAPNYQLNARFADELLAGVNCAVIAEAGFKYGVQAMVVRPDLEADGGIVFQINGAELRLSRAGIDLDSVVAAEVGLASYYNYATGDDESDYAEDLEAAGDAAVPWDEPLENGEDEESGQGKEGTAAGQGKPEEGEQQSTASKTVQSGGRQVYLRLLDDQDLTVSATIKEDSNGGWNTKLTVSAPEFSFTFTRGPTPSGGVEIAIRVEVDPVMLDSLHGLVGQTVFYPEKEGQDWDYIVSNSLADDFSFNRFTALTPGGDGERTRLAAAAAVAHAAFLEDATSRLTELAPLTGLQDPLTLTAHVADHMASASEGVAAEADGYSSGYSEGEVYGDEVDSTAGEVAGIGVSEEQQQDTDEVQVTVEATVAWEGMGAEPPLTEDEELELAADVTSALASALQRQFASAVGASVIEGGSEEVDVPAGTVQPAEVADA